MTDEKTLEEQLEEAKAALETKEEELKETHAELEKQKEKGKSINDLSKKAKELEKEKVSAEALARQALDELNQFKAEQEEKYKVITSTAANIQKERMDALVANSNLSEEELKTVNDHYENSLTADDSTFEGMKSRWKQAIALAGASAPQRDVVMNVASMGGSPQVIESSAKLSQEDLHYAKKMNIAPEEWAKFKGEGTFVHG